MFVRIVEFVGAGDVDAGIRVMEETVVPVLRQQKGYRGAVATVDRAAGVFGVLSRWDTAADREASDSALAKSREEGKRAVGGDMVVRMLEEVLYEQVAAPEPGLRLMITRADMAPGDLDRNLEFFRREVLPDISSTPGFRSIRQMVDRSSGQTVVGTAWEDEAALQAAAAEARVRQQQGEQRGITFGERSFREVVFVDPV